MPGVFVISAAATRFAAQGHPRDRGPLDAAAAAALSGLTLDRRRIPMLLAGARAEQPTSPAALFAVEDSLRQLDQVEADGRISSPAEALHVGYRAVELGVYDVVMCVAADRPGTNGVDSWPGTRAVRPHAAAAQRYMWDSGATARHLAKVTAKNRGNGALNPLAGCRRVEAEAVLGSEMVAWPLRRLMVAPCGNGAAAVILASATAKRRIGGRALRVRASVAARDQDLNDRWAARSAYQGAQLGPEDIDCAEVDDLTAAAELGAYEALQFVPGFQGPELIDSGFTALDGVTPVNTSGGMLSLGVSAATAIAQLCEVIAQLRGSAGPRQVPGARVGLVHTRVPIRGPQGAATVVTILSSR
jgi:acetyl-CoA acetyltransferase